MDQRPLVEGYIANFGISLEVFKFFPFGIFFPFLIFFGSCVFLVNPTVVSVLLSASVERFNVSRIRDFLFAELYTVGQVFASLPEHVHHKILSYEEV